MPQQNVYDDPVFFAGYKRLRELDSGLNGVLEEPAMLKLLPPLDGLRVLDLGCGLGDLARRVRQAGAAHVTGVELSQKMLAAATSATNDPEITFIRSAIEDFDFGESRWDLVVSSLALHYVEDFRSVVGAMASGLADGGVLTFSVEHPMCTAHPIGWVRNADGQAIHWPVDRYADEGARETRWFVDGVIKYHRTVSTYLNELIRAGLSIEQVAEPLPSDAAQARRPDLNLECRRPPFLLVRARKTGPTQA